MVYWIFFIGAIEVPSLAVILFYVVWNLLSHFQILPFIGGGEVAYMAHLAGYTYGFVIGMGLLLAGVLPREPYDMLALIERQRRRLQFKRMARGGYQPWDHVQPSEPATRQQPPEIQPQQQQLMAKRSEVSQALARYDMPAAAQRYRELLAAYPDQVMGQQQQLDIANQLMSDGHHAEAAQAYELFLKHYASYPQREQVQLILGLLYVRYLHQVERARELLCAACATTQRLQSSARRPIARRRNVTTSPADTHATAYICIPQARTERRAAKPTERRPGSSRDQTTSTPCNARRFALPRLEHPPRFPWNPCDGISRQPPQSRAESPTMSLLPSSDFRGSTRRPATNR